MKLGVALKAIETALAETGASKGRSGVVFFRPRCQVIPGPETVPPHFVAEDCATLAINAYEAYLDTGDPTWFDAALASWNYAWNFDFGRGCCYDSSDTREFVEEQLRNVIAHEFPQFADQVP